MRAKRRYTIKKLKSKNTYKELTLQNNDFYRLPYSACVDKDCVVLQEGSNLFITCKNGNVKIYPTYCERVSIGVGGFLIELLIKEITDDEELKSYEALAKFHYKEKHLFGRTSILVATSTTPYLPKVIGYIELSTPFYVNKPRSEVLNAPFKHNGISWDLWDKDSTKKYINAIVRIARCVVYPEFRGVGLGKILIGHAQGFAIERWQISKLKPLFIEISADMLKYVPFAQTAGMHYIGETEGNLSRVHKDLGYLLTNYQRYQDKEIVSEKQMGIVEQQKSRLRKAIKIAQNSGLTIEEFINKLGQLKKRSTLKDFTFFSGLVSLPKPTYIKGLDDITEDFLADRVNGINARDDTFYERIKAVPLNASITIEKLSIVYNSKIRQTQKTQAIHNAFSILPSDIESPIINNLSFQVNPGEIMLVIGSSGSGKTTLINFLSGGIFKKKDVSIHGSYTFPSNFDAGTLKEIKSARALIEVFGRYDINFSLQLMGTVGLSDAYVYLKRYQELSKGQQFRAQFASALLAKSNTLIVDEFCSNLDPITSNVISHRIRQLTKRLGVTLIVAAPHCENFIHSLQPDKVLRLSTAWDYEIIPGMEFANRYAPKVHHINFPTLKLDTKRFSEVVSGRRNIVIEKGKTSLKLGNVILESSKGFVNGYVKGIQEKKLSEIDISDADNYGARSILDVKRSLRRRYPNIGSNSIVSIYDIGLLNFKS